MNEEKCAFCSEKAEIQSLHHIYNGYEYRCKNCGNYVLEVNIRDYILGETFDSRHDIAGYLRAICPVTGAAKSTKKTD